MKHFMKILSKTTDTKLNKPKHFFFFLLLAWRHFSIYSCVVLFVFLFLRNLKGCQKRKKNTWHANSTMVTRSKMS